MNTNKLRALLKALKIIMKCPNCGRRYNLDEIFFTGSMGRNYFLKMRCTNCRVPIFATIAINGNLVQNDSITDRPATFQKTTPKKAIGSDEILKLHQFLESFNGDFKNYLKNS